MRGEFEFWIGHKLQACASGGVSHTGDYGSYGSNGMDGWECGGKGNFEFWILNWHKLQACASGGNKGHKEYNDYIKEQLEDIWDKGKDGKWTQQQFRDTIEELRRETRLELRNGSGKCYSIH